jgi:ABC-type multidrug transport system ATPase subunit
MEIILRAEDLSSKYENKKKLQIGKNKFQFSSRKSIGLHPCSFEIRKNSMVAILGPTGCGKSTLLKTLIGLNPIYSGKVYIEGHDLSLNYEKLKSYIGYVPQNDRDAIHFDLTVIQCLTFSARLRLPDLETKHQNTKIEYILKKLNLYQEKDKLIKNLSGGQQKRVSIAVELLIDPIILFLDEPTSPLDPQTIADFLLMLRSLTILGTTVVMVTHKPEDLEYMDECIFMGIGGFFAYKGNKNSIYSYFNKSNILEIYKLLNSSKTSIYGRNYYLNNSLSPKKKISSNLKLHSMRNINYFSQLFYLSLRLIQRKLNDYESLLVTLLQAPTIALLMSLIFPTINNIVLFFIVISAIWFGTNNSSKEIVSEKAIFTRERMYNQGIIPYILSKLLILTSIGIFQSILFITILSIHFNNNKVVLSKVFFVFSWMSLSIFISSLFGLFLSAISNSSEKVMGIIPIALIPQIMISGVIAKITSSSVIKYFSYFTIARWSTTGLARIQNKIENSISPQIISSLNSLKPTMGDTYESYFKLNNSDFSLELIVLLLHGLVYFIFIYFSLKIRDIHYRQKINIRF